MTREREEIAERIDEEMPFGADVARAVRSLPVLPTCGWCRHLSTAPRGVLYCEKERRDLPSDHERRPVAPPSWCPLRGTLAT